ncbi:MAG TPA: hypothetical protein VJL27_03020 [Patescibacteria group bacterium]|nr:hypothetical protein [Patescibacteria group bacterium]
MSSSLTDRWKKMPSANAESVVSCLRQVPQDSVAWLQELHIVINKPREVKVATGTRHEYTVTVFDTIRQLTEDELLAILREVQDHQVILWIKTSGNYSFGYSIWRRPDNREINDNDDFLLWISPEHFPLTLLSDLTSRPSPQDINDAVFSFMEKYLRDDTNLTLLARYSFNPPRDRGSYEY